MATIEFSPNPSGAAPRDAGAALAQALHRWWRALSMGRNVVAAPARPADTLDELVGLDARILRDIGAPDRLLARALAHRDTERGERDALHLGSASGAWQHW